MVDTRKIAKELRLSHWAQIIREKNQRGLSAAAYCKEIGISKNTYFYWQKKIREAMCEELLAQQPVEPIVADNATQSWTVCEVAPTTDNKTLPIEINGCRILASVDTSPELLAKACKVLMSLC